MKNSSKVRSATRNDESDDGTVFNCAALESVLFFMFCIRIGRQFVVFLGLGPASPERFRVRGNSSLHIFPRNFLDGGTWV